MTPVSRSIAAILLALPPGLGLLVAPAAIASPPAIVRPTPEPTARPGDRTVWVGFSQDTPAARAKLEALGFRQRAEVRVMRAVGGHKVCEALFEGFLPATALDAARAVPGVSSVSPRP